MTADELDGVADGTVLYRVHDYEGDWRQECGLYRRLPHPAGGPPGHSVNWPGGGAGGAAAAMADWHRTPGEAWRAAGRWGEFTVPNPPAEGGGR